MLVIATIYSLIISYIIILQIPHTSGPHGKSVRLCPADVRFSHVTFFGQMERDPK
jgi:hypothetical protein